MSFLTRRRSRLDSLTTASTTSDTSKQTGIVNRVSKLFSNEPTPGHAKGHSRLKSFGRGILGKASKRKADESARYNEWNQSDESQEYDPSIRRPSGLGERKESTSSDGSEISWVEGGGHLRHLASQAQGQHGQDEQARSPSGGGTLARMISSPELLAYFPSPPGTVLKFDHPPQPFPLPDQVLPVILGFLPPEKIPQAARISRAFLSAARQVLYKEVNLAQVPRTRVHSCLETLGRVSEAAKSIHTFTCLLEKDDVDADLALFRALRNMSNLKSLTLSRLPLRLTGRRSRVGNTLEFSLTSLTLLETNLAQDDLTALFAFLSKQSSIKTLSLPNLRINTEDSVPSNDPSVLPILSSLVIPPPLISLFVPTRPVTDLTINIYETLVEGLRPSTLLSFLPEARKRVTKLCISFQETIDRRTVERVLGAVQKECHGMVEELQVRWATGSTSVLYKQISAILPKFTVLHTLRLRVPASSLLAHAPPVLSTPSSPVILSTPSSPAILSSPSPSLTPSRTPSVSASIMTSASSTAPSLSSKKSTHSVRRKPVPKLEPHELESLNLLSPSSLTFSPPAPSSSSFSEPAEETAASKEHTRERALLSAWSKSNAALARVEFVSGAEWVRREGGAGGGASRRKDKWVFATMRRD
ncbi:hypothetical protein GLOTRDRAFT_131336 [Gloeophyllum trabeum ATCC 11539]|uniref:F-box domain-containing protein n=1 Tax=Gloeophyllum trabeum (strain ATCC 11539 / FP-39264 / Madison 617) TaxID=670483 RepID=S7Q0U5_GLOTA|nr:uncharacterized protein GLOTRDRAFT_131336 [Gloeophyllum trabeum ATCC 11539]EPQ53388.1 hypothetical protein GLOTRDRAFT_131336 [Gloeophyllum trabeum ATCC 11539]